MKIRIRLLILSIVGLGMLPFNSCCEASDVGKSFAFKRGAYFAWSSICHGAIFDINTIPTIVIGALEKYQVSTNKVEREEYTVESSVPYDEAGNEIPMPFDEVQYAGQNITWQTKKITQYRDIVPTFDEWGYRVSISWAEPYRESTIFPLECDRAGVQEFLRGVSDYFQKLNVANQFQDDQDNPDLPSYGDFHPQLTGMQSLLRFINPDVQLEAQESESFLGSIGEKSSSIKFVVGVGCGLAGAALLYYVYSRRHAISRIFSK
ncbi:MAG: hypothetical protein LBF65_02080 [Holosporales bacterium]|jgi:hypothetical protein|nr:hypothetical protein [Holosporales bacterium]